MSLRTRLEIYFGFAAHTTNWRTEILAGFTTFITMAYIVFVNPSILTKPACRSKPSSRPPVFAPPSAAS